MSRSISISSPTRRMRTNMDSPLLGVFGSVEKSFIQLDFDRVLLRLRRVVFQRHARKRCVQTSQRIRRVKRSRMLPPSEVRGEGISRWKVPQCGQVRGMEKPQCLLFVELICGRVPSQSRSHAKPLVRLFTCKSDSGQRRSAGFADVLYRGLKLCLSSCLDSGQLPFVAASDVLSAPSAESFARKVVREIPSSSLAWTWLPETWSSTSWSRRRSISV